MEHMDNKLVRKFKCKKKINPLIDDQNTVNFHTFLFAKKNSKFY